jgi:hypothetical protein
MVILEQYEIETHFSKNFISRRGENRENVENATSVFK